MTAKFKSKIEQLRVERDAEANRRVLFWRVPKTEMGAIREAITPSQENISSPKTVELLDQRDQGVLDNRFGMELCPECKVLKFDEEIRGKGFAGWVKTYIDGYWHLVSVRPNIRAVVTICDKEHDLNTLVTEFADFVTLPQMREQVETWLSVEKDKLNRHQRTTDVTDVATGKERKNFALKVGVLEKLYETTFDLTRWQRRDSKPLNI